MGRKRDATQVKPKNGVKSKKPKHQLDPKPFGFSKGNSFSDLRVLSCLC